MSSANHDDVDALFSRGEFLRFIELSRTQSSADAMTDGNQRLKLANALALTGDLLGASQIARRYADAGYGSALRSRAECVLALAARRDGDITAARKHFQSALRLASESRDPERIAWTHLHLLRFHIDFHPADVVLSLLPAVRKAVLGAGNTHATAYLHCCVSILEGQMGKIDEAWRHCQLAESLLDKEPNAWLLGNLLLNKACLASLNCEFKEAETYIKGAREAHSLSSDRRSIIIDSSLGYIQLQTGQFKSAQRTLQGILDDPAIGEGRKQAVRETLARLHMTLNETDQCTSQLDKLAGDGLGSDGVPAYIARWAGVTKARLLMRQGAFRQAVEQLRVLERENTQPAHDRHFAAALHLILAQALSRSGNRADAARRLFRAVESGITRHRDLLGQYYFGSGAILSDSPALADQQRDRAMRVWAHQDLVASRLEIEEQPLNAEQAQADLKTAERISPSISFKVESITNALAATIDLAHSPRLFGRELVSIIEAVQCGSDATLIETRRKDLPREDMLQSVLPLGERHGMNLFLRCTVPVDPPKAVLLADILRIGRAALALEKAKQDERRRTALWPVTPIEEQAGALFIAEEMQTLLAMARRVATSNIPVLITGETGTGKEVLARLIHGYSSRAQKTFLPFNCSATPREMLDAQLFGHRKGAFTGAMENFQGVIRAAAGGTLFLDEIGESTLDIQPKLLRFLESGEVHPLGETHPQRVDVRVLAATNADVDTLISQGRFREDLFYRLNVVRLPLPPLRERRVEIPSFATHYLQKYARETGKGDLRLAEETMEYLVLYRWPGNVRQVANEMRRLVALAEPGAVLMPEHLSHEIVASRRTVPAAERTLDANEIVVRTDQPLSAAVHYVEQKMVESAMATTGSVDEAAKLLGLSRKGLYLKRQRFGMDIDRPRGESGGIEASHRAMPPAGGPAPAHVVDNG